MTVSLAALQAIAAEHTGEGFLGLVTINFPDKAPIRLVFNPTAVPSRGNVFSPAPIDIKLASSIPGEPARASLIVAGMTQVNINELITSSGGDITVDIEYVLTSALDTVQEQNLGMILREFTISNGDILKAELVGPAFFRQAFPGIPMNISTVPGIFRTTP